MSTVSNPYTFNIKSNCGFSTDALISNNQAKITMVYDENTYEIEHPSDEPIYYTNYSLYYNSNNGKGNMIPNIINGNTITGIYCSYTDGFYEDPSTVSISMISSKKYSKIHLNGGPIKNCSLTYDHEYNNIKWYKSDLDNYNLGQYDKIPFDLTIKFVE